MDNLCNRSHFLLLGQLNKPAAMSLRAMVGLELYPSIVNPGTYQGLQRLNKGVNPHSEAIVLDEGPLGSKDLYASPEAFWNDYYRDNPAHALREGSYELTTVIHVFVHRKVAHIQRSDFRGFVRTG